MKKIIHVDADSFFASIEMRDNPELATQPLAVGGQPGQRGVVATCNYLAREYGIHSAMSSSLAQRKCPQLVFVKPRFAVYKEVSQQIHEIFHDYTDLIEPLSLDEAYLDVSACTQHQGSATLIAEEIRQRVRDSIGVTVSAGVAPNKFLAKVASDWNKPDGVFVITPAQVENFVRELPVKKINGVGRKTAEKLAAKGIYTCGDLQAYNLTETVALMGSFGERLYQMCRGIDRREVKTSRIRKSCSVETTYHNDISDPQQIAAAIDTLLEELRERFARHREHYVPTSRIVKIKYFDFQQTTAEEAISDYATPWDSEAPFRSLAAKAWQRQSKAVRLLGVGVKLKTLEQFDKQQQYSLF